MKKMKKMNAQQRNAQHNAQNAQNNAQNNAKNEHNQYAKQGFVNINLGNEGNHAGTVMPHHTEEHPAKRGMGAYPKQEKPGQGYDANPHKASKPARPEQINWGAKAPEQSKKGK